MTGRSKGQKAPSRGCRRFCVFLAVHVHGVLNGIIIYYAVLPLKIRFGIFFFGGWRMLLTFFMPTTCMGFSFTYVITSN